MRDITAHPVTVDEVSTALHNHVMDDGKMDTETLALCYLRDFISNVEIRSRLIEFLDIVQPKHVDSRLEKLDKETLQQLLKTAYHSEAYPCRFTAYRYVGKSKRGSYVYQLDSTMLSVRLMGGEPRGELNEDNFTLPKKELPASPIRHQPIESTPDAPVSATGGLFRSIKKWFE